MRDRLLGFNLFTGGIVTIVAVVVLLGAFLIRSNMEEDLKKSAEEYLITQLENWKKGGINNVAILIPRDFDGSLADWELLKLKDYFIEDTKVASHYRGRRSWWKYLDRNYMQVYVKVELTMEDQDGYTEDYSIIYNLEPRGGDWFVRKAYHFPLF